MAALSTISLFSSVLLVLLIIASSSLFLQLPVFANVILQFGVFKHNVVLECKTGQVYWPASEHESLVIGLCFPFIQHPPWKPRNSAALLGVERLLRSVLQVKWFSHSLTQDWNVQINIKITDRNSKILPHLKNCFV